MKATYKSRDKWPQVRVTMIADQHLIRVLRAMRKQGLAVSKTSLVSEAILSIPIPNGHVTQAAVEIRKINEDARNV